MIRRQSAALLTAVKADQRRKYAPGSDKVVIVIGQDIAIVILFDLSSEDVSFMTGLGASFWPLPIMPGSNA
jgi:hypothetical protein